MIHLRDLKHDPQNARQHNPRNIGMIAESLQKYGPARSIAIDEDNIILAGNGVVEAAAQIGVEYVRVYDRATGQLDPEPPEGEPYIFAVRVSGLSPEQKIEYAIADNRTTDLSAWNPEVLASFAEDGIDLIQFWFEEELNTIWEHGADDLLGGEAPDTDDAHNDHDTDEEGAGAEASTGELLALVDVTIDEPRHQVKAGERWRVGPHLLVCASVMNGHDLWRNDLDTDSLFCPYPGPFVPLTLRAEQHRLVMVQPNTYIAGHILDRYAEVKGEGEVSRA